MVNEIQKMVQTSNACAKQAYLPDNSSDTARHGVRQYARWALPRICLQMLSHAWLNSGRIYAYMGELLYDTKLS